MAVGGSLGGALAFLRRFRAPLVLVPLVAALVVVAVVGARMLWREVPSTASATADVVCWDGSEAPADECPEPTGARGLHWVFPSFQAGNKRCEKLGPRGQSADRPLEYRCTLQVKKGRVQVTYTRRTGVESGLRMLRRAYDPVRPSATNDDGRILYRDPEKQKDGTYRLSVAYRDHPFSVTVESKVARLRDLALAESVQLRGSGYVTVRPAEG